MTTAPSTWKAVGTAVLTALVVLTLATAALAGPGGNGKGKGGKGKPSPSPTPSPTVSEDPPPVAGPNQADERFIEMMIPHHHQALVLSQFVPDRTTNTELLSLAARIHDEQTVEIGTMQQWQAYHGLEVTNPEAAYAMMMQDPMMVEIMGMATQAELDLLETLTGDAFDELFLQLMIDHHQGAVDMCVDVMTNGHEPVLQQIANDMLAAQTAQISLMQEMLAAVG